MCTVGGPDPCPSGRDYLPACLLAHAPPALLLPLTSYRPEQQTPPQVLVGEDEGGLPESGTILVDYDKGRSHDGSLMYSKLDEGAAGGGDDDDDDYDSFDESDEPED